MTEIAHTRQHPCGNLLLEIGEESLDPFVRRFESHLIEAHDRSQLLASRGFVRDQDWPGVGTSPPAITLHELDVPSPGAHVHSERESTDGGNLPGSLTCRAYRELDPAPRPHTHEIGSAILHVQVIVDPNYVDPFLAWYVNEHVPAVLAAPGMIAARRFEQIQPVSDVDPSDRPRRYRTVYEMTEAAVIRRPETLEASLRGAGACPSELEPHRRASNQVYEETFREITT